MIDATSSYKYVGKIMSSVSLFSIPKWKRQVNKDYGLKILHEQSNCLMYGILHLGIDIVFFNRGLIDKGIKYHSRLKIRNSKI